MSSGLDALSLQEDDVTKLLACGTHLGASNINFQMAQYVYKRKNDGKTLVMIASVATSGSIFFKWFRIRYNYGDYYSM